MLIETNRAYGRGLLAGISRFLGETNSWSVYITPYDLGASLHSWPKKWRGDGVLARITSPTFARLIKETGIPLIDLWGGGESIGLPPFGIDNARVTALAFDHLHSLVLKRFGYYGEAPYHHHYGDERAQCFRRTVEDHGYRCDVFRSARGSSAIRTWENEQSRLQEWIVALPKPVGILTWNDVLGQRLLNACRQTKHNVPEEVAVLGVDNDRLLCGLSTPALSSVDVNTERIGYEAAGLLDRMMTCGEQFSKPVLFGPAGVVSRQSTDATACSDREIAMALSFIRDRACQGIRVTDIEEHVVISRCVLNRRFKNIVGRSPKEEILRVQIETAKRLLIDTDASISSIGYKTGFRDAKYFIARFRKHTGTTPRVFRDTHGRHLSS